MLFLLRPPWELWVWPLPLARGVDPLRPARHYRALPAGGLLVTLCLRASSAVDSGDWFAEACWDPGRAGGGWCPLEDCDETGSPLYVPSGRGRSLGSVLASLSARLGLSPRDAVLRECVRLAGDGRAFSVALSVMES